MKAERWQKIDELFCSALDCKPEDRARFLTEACADDESLRKEVEALLASHQQAGSFIQSPAVEAAMKLIADEPSEPIAGRRIGAYETVREIGQGGMGSVYLAQRADDQYKKQVAIKLVRQSFDNPLVVSRFLGERQILAKLDHPNIARLLDGGTLEDGSPYLVMEYIAGFPIDQYCDRHNLSTVKRLKLFRTVCSAVQYAHQNLVIHRDIKPSNLLVTEDGIPKLLDFGIAKILNPDAAPQPQTATAARMMTPDYASPEQVRGEQITTSSDIYSLGVLLYKLLTGRHPYHFKTPLSREIERVICESEPEKPSTAITRVEQVTTPDGAMSIALTPEAVSRVRETQPDKLRRLLKGDIDNIVLMAMRKEPERRYSSVEGLSEDIRRHLAGLPVIARKDTFSYRATKFIARHKASVAAASAVVLTLMAGIIATTWQARAAREQRDSALAQQAKAQRINTFLQSVLQYANPAWYSAGKDKGPNTTTLDALNDAAKRVDSELPDQPEVRADLHQTIGDTYRALGFYDEAEHHFEASLQIRRDLFGEDSVKVAENLFYLGAVQNAKGNYSEAEQFCRQALVIQRRRPDEGNNLPFMIQELTSSLIARGCLAGVEALDREALEIFRRRYGNQDIRVAFACASVGRDYYCLGDLEKAEEHLQEALRLLPQKSVEAAGAWVGLGEIYAAKGAYQEAEPLLREAVDTYRQAFGAIKSPHTIVSYSSLIRLLCLKGDYAEAKTVSERLAGVLQQTESTEQVSVVYALTVLGSAFSQTGQLARAESYLREALSRGSRFMVGDSRFLAEAKGALGECLMAQKRYAEAEPLLIESYLAFKANQVAQSPRIKESLSRLVNLHQARGNPETAANYRALLQATSH